MRRRFHLKYKHTFCLMLALWAAHGWAAPGLMQTSGGKTYQGELQPGKGEFVIATTNGVQRVPLQQVARLRLQSPSELVASATNVLHGLRGTYFVNPDFTGDSVVRIDPKIDFDWQGNAPLPGVGPGEFSVRWEGKIQAPASGKFHFYTQGHTVRLWIANRLLVDKLDDMTTGDSSEGIEMEKGKYYSVKLEFSNRSYSAVARLFWNGPDMNSGVAPNEVFFPSPLDPADHAQVPKNGLLGIYFKGMDVSGECFTRYDAAVDFDWGEDAPLEGISPEQFSVRWQAKLIPPTSEPYIFQVKAEDGARLWVNGNLIIDAWQEEPVLASSVPARLTAGEKCDLRLEMFCARGKSSVKLLWSSPSVPLAVIPSSQLVPMPTTDLDLPNGTNRPNGSEMLPSGVLLASGSFLAWPFDTVDQSAVKLSGGADSPPLSLVNVARIILQPLTPEWSVKLTAGRTGLLLSNKDFIEGEFQGVADGQVAINSVLFGTKIVALTDAMAVVLRDLRPPTVQYQIRARDGSVFMANDLRVAQDALVFQEPVLNLLRLAWADLMEIKRNE